MRCPSNNSRNTISAVTVIPPFFFLSACESASRNATADAALLRPNVCFIWALRLKYTCGSNMWPSAPTETDRDPARSWCAPRWNVPHRHQNEVRQGHVFENLTHILQELCHRSSADESTLHQRCQATEKEKRTQLRKSKGHQGTAHDYCKTILTPLQG